MTNRILLGGWALLAPLVALAQYGGEPSNASPVGTRAEGTSWVWAIAVIALIAVVFFGLRAFQRNRGGPHGPQAPTPRGP